MSLLNNASDVKVGSTQVEKVFLGTTLVWTNTVYYNLTLDKTRDGANQSLSDSLTMTGAGSYADGTQVAITATPDMYWKFRKWEDTSQVDQSHIADPYSASTTITLTRDTTIKAVITTYYTDISYNPNSGGTSLGNGPVLTVSHPIGQDSINRNQILQVARGTRVALQSSTSTGFTFSNYTIPANTSLVSGFTNSSNPTKVYLVSGAGANFDANYNTTAYGVTVYIDINNFNGVGNNSRSQSQQSFGDTINLNANAPANTTFSAWTVTSGGTIASASSEVTTGTITIPTGTVTYTTTLVSQAPVGGARILSNGGIDNHGFIYSQGMDNHSGTSLNKHTALAIRSDGGVYRTGDRGANTVGWYETYSSGSGVSTIEYSMFKANNVFPVAVSQSNCEQTDSDIRFDMTHNSTAPAGVAVAEGSYFRPSVYPAQSNYTENPTSFNGNWSNLMNGASVAGCLYSNGRAYPGHTHTYYKVTGTDKKIYSRGSNMWGCLGNYSGGTGIPVLNYGARTPPTLFDRSTFGAVKTSSNSDITGVVRIMCSQENGNNSNRNQHLGGACVFLTDGGNLYIIGDTQSMFSATNRYKPYARIIDTGVADFYYTQGSIAYRKNLSEASPGKWVGDLYERPSSSTSNSLITTACEGYACGGSVIYCIKGTTLYGKGDNSMGQLGDGTFTNASTLKSIATDAVQVSTTGSDTWYLTSGGQVKHTGRNYQSIRGDGSGLLFGGTGSGYNTWSAIQTSSTDTSPFSPTDPITSIVLCQERQGYLFSGTAIYAVGQRGGFGNGTSGYYSWPEAVNTNALGWIF